MLKVLIVDDEFIVRTGLISCIDWKQMNLTLVGEAANGQEALDLIYAKQPDIILLDLIMPVMNGMELIQKLSKQKIKTNIIILSCHEDYNYVREAFKLGVRDYILKLSSTPDEICQVIRDVVKNILQEQTKLSSTPKILLPLKNPQAIPKHHHYLVAAFHIPDQKSVTATTDQLLTFTKHWLTDHATIIGNTSTSILDGTLPFLIYTFDPLCLSHERALINFTELVSQLHTDLIKKIKHNLQFGISGISPASWPFMKAYREALKALDEFFYDDQLFIATYAHINTIYAADYETNITPLCENVSALLERKQYDKIPELVTNYYINLQQKKDIDPRIIKLESIDFINSLNNGLRKYNYSLSDIDEEYLYYYQNIANMHLLESLGQYVLELTRNICTFLENHGPKAIRYDILDTLAFIESHFGEDITLQNVADHISISKNHLSYLFKKEMGQTFSDYLIQLRLEKAKQLLSVSSSLSISDVAEQVGFNDTGYFGKVFKKATGFSPYHYKRGI